MRISLRRAAMTICVMSTPLMCPMSDPSPDQLPEASLPEEPLPPPSSGPSPGEVDVDPTAVVEIPTPPKPTHFYLPRT